MKYRSRFPNSNKHRGFQVRLTSRLAACVAVAFATWGNRPAAASACERGRTISVPMAIQDGLISVQGAINGKPARFIVDTGGSFGMMELSTAQRYGLRIETRSRSLGSIYGRIAVHDLAYTDALQVGTLRGGETAFALVPRDLMGDAIDASLGGDYLRAFDVDLNFPAGTLTLFPRADCGAGLERIEARAADMLHDRGRHVLLAARLGGAKLIAVLDTGAAKSAIDAQAAADLFGENFLGECRKSDSYISLNGGAARATFPHEFTSLEVAGWSIPHPRIRTICTQSEGPRAPQLILGMDLLRRFRVIISYADEKVYLVRAEQSAH